MATVPFAGMVNGTVRPPVVNWTAGSLPSVPEVVSVRTPLIATGYGLASVNVTLGWDCGATVPLGPDIV